MRREPRLVLPLPLGACALHARQVGRVKVGAEGEPRPNLPHAVGPVGLRRAGAVDGGETARVFAQGKSTVRKRRRSEAPGAKAQ